MADNLSKRTPQDASRISTSEEWELSYWTKSLNCSREELTQAVKAVGNSADMVKTYLKKK